MTKTSPLPSKGILKQIVLYCDTLTIPQGTVVDVNQPSGVLLNIFCRKINHVPGADGTSITMAMSGNAQIGFYSSSLPQDFAVGAKVSDRLVMPTKLAIQAGKFGVVLRRNGSNLDIQQRDPPDLEMQAANYLDLIKEDGTIDTSSDFRNE